MNQYKYYAAEWVANDAEMKDIDPLYDAAVYLRCLFWHYPSVTERGFATFIFTIRVISDDVFQAFIALVGHLMPSVEWKPESHPSEIPPDEALGVSLSRLSGNLRSTIYEPISLAASRNERLLERQKLGEIPD